MTTTTMMNKTRQNIRDHLQTAVTPATATNSALAHPRNVWKDSAYLPSPARAAPWHNASGDASSPRGSPAVWRWQKNLPLLLVLLPLLRLLPRDPPWPWHGRSAWEHGNWRRKWHDWAAKRPYNREAKKPPKQNQRASARRTQEPRTQSSERCPAALRLPKFSPNSCPTSMQLFNYFSDFKNTYWFQILTFHGEWVYTILSKYNLIISIISCIWNILKIIFCLHNGMLKINQ